MEYLYLFIIISNLYALALLLHCGFHIKRLETKIKDQQESIDRQAEHIRQLEKQLISRVEKK